MTRSALSRLAAVTAVAFGLAMTGCSAGTPAAVTTSAAAPGEVAGFEEFPIGDDVEAGPLNVAGVYFQPVDMEPAGMGLAAADSDMHIEADISARADNKLGFGAGDFVPGLTVDYQITSAAGKVAKGTFMPMNASDGPHYGANIKLGDAGTYQVKFVIHSPAETGYLVHTDKLTGVEGRFWDKPLEAKWSFDYVPREW